jgi:hypothetical protein
MNWGKIIFLKKKTKKTTTCSFIMSKKRGLLDGRVSNVRNISTAGPCKHLGSTVCVCVCVLICANC